MTITQYIKGNDELKELDFVSVYVTIITLIQDKKLSWNTDV